MATKHTPPLDSGIQVVVVNPLPSSTAGTFGSYATGTFTGPAANFMLFSGTYVPNGVSSEQINISFKVTYSDTTTATYGPAALAGNATAQSISGVAIYNLAKTGVWITAVAAEAKSNISSSTATPQVTFCLLPVS